jgi:hypothetical protein
MQPKNRERKIFFGVETKKLFLSIWQILQIGDSVIIIFLSLACEKIVKSNYY